MSKASQILGHMEEAERYQSRIDPLKQIIHRQFYIAKEGTYANGEQAYQAFPLLVDLMPDSLKPQIDQMLRYLIIEKNKGHLDTGMLGTYFMLKYLTLTNQNDLIYEMVNQKTFPGWGYMIENNATTAWEQWNGQNSQIHNCYLSVGAWFINGLGGIRPDWQKPGFEHFIVEPGIIDGLDYVETSYQSIKGKIISNWRKHGDEMHMKIRIPNNSCATLVLPREKWEKVQMNGQKIFALAKLPNGKLELNPGEYKILLK